eukprot:Trichotokara_eunicae@DN2670_c0_g1_i2.p1
MAQGAPGPTERGPANVVGGQRTVARRRAPGNSQGQRENQQSGNSGVRKNAAQQPQPGGVMKFYQADAPGFQISPTSVLMFTLAFMFCVVLLHLFSKIKSIVVA